jgi:hypothetical protein
VNTRTWALVALFGGIVVMFGLWMVMSGGSGTEEAASRAAAAAGQPAEKPRDRFKAQEPISPAEIAKVSKLTAADVIARQRMVQGLRDHGGRGPGAPPPPTAGGGVLTLDETGVKVAVESRRADLDACWQAAKAHQPGISADVTLALELKPVEGHHYSTVANVSSEAGSALDACATTVLQDVKFGTSEPVTLRYPISFGS